jgi:hypothetical protein
MTLAISSNGLLLDGGGAVLGVTVPATAGAPGRNSRPMTAHPATHVEHSAQGHE